MGNTRSELIAKGAKNGYNYLRSLINRSVMDTRQFFRLGSGGRKQALKVVEDAERAFATKKAEIDAVTKTLKDRGLDLSTSQNLKNLRQEYRQLNLNRLDANKKLNDILRSQARVKPLRFAGLAGLGYTGYQVGSLLLSDRNFPDFSMLTIPRFSDNSDSSETLTQNPMDNQGLIFQEDTTTPTVSTTPTTSKSSRNTQVDLSDLFSNDSSEPTSDQLKLLQSLLGVTPTGKWDINTQNALKSQGSKYSDDGGYFTYYG